MKQSKHIGWIIWDIVSWTILWIVLNIAYTAITLCMMLKYLETTAGHIGVIHLGILLVFLFSVFSFGIFTIARSLIDSIDRYKAWRRAKTIGKD